MCFVTLYALSDFGATGEKGLLPINDFEDFPDEALDPVLRKKNWQPKVGLHNLISVT